MVKVKLELPPNVSDEVERLLVERCQSTRGAMVDIAAKQALDTFKTANALWRAVNEPKG